MGRSKLASSPLFILADFPSGDNGAGGSSLFLPHLARTASQRHFEFVLWHLPLPFAVHSIQYLSLLLCSSYQVLGSALGPDGFETLRVIREDKPDLLILDYQLPRMNGIDLYDKIHALPRFEYIPGIIVSAQLPQREIEKRTLVGSSKPFELGELFDALEQFLA